jgi:hypothetical protein
MRARLDLNRSQYGRWTWAFTSEAGDVVSGLMIVAPQPEKDRERKVVRARLRELGRQLTDTFAIDGEDTDANRT